MGTREIDTIGTERIIKKVRNRGRNYKTVFSSIDIDTLDPPCTSSLCCPANFIRIGYCFGKIAVVLELLLLAIVAKLNP